MATAGDLGSLQRGPSKPPTPKKNLPDLHSMKLNHLPDNLRKLADEVLKEKYA